MKYTTEQQQEIAQYAIDHERDFKATGAKYDISYQQVAAWVRKYDPENQATQTPKKKETKKATTKKAAAKKTASKKASKKLQQKTPVEEVEKSKSTTNNGENDSEQTSTLDILSRRDPVLEKQLEDVKRRLGLIK
ncbi:helix-turn-helix domain-containing protein [Companilactobacillus zhongbaensis]|uniref:helix-turn-helix domain-containing protein n=1 Tax=Companilactobacillus zhongbaensis TaxID=2486009 RepID=UPI000F7747B6|nr:helix-turn-helix domain-containing protein [Companilactobacillus zhongbaensis]